MVQHAMIVTRDRAASLESLNDYLEDGWKVVHSCPMPCGNSSINPTCLVIIEIEEKANEA